MHLHTLDVCKMVTLPKDGHPSHSNQLSSLGVKYVNFVDMPNDASTKRRHVRPRPCECVFVCVCSIGASLHIYRTSLESLDLRSLQSIRNGGVLIKLNPRLCYVDNVRWDLIQSSPDQKLLVAGNANASQCGMCRMNAVCD